MLRTFIILLILIPTYSFAQVKNIGTPFIKNYAKADYQAGTQNWGISQDQNGFMYFANNDGVLRYDGFNWGLFKVPLSLVRSVFVDSQNRIFVALLSDFGILEQNNSGNYSYVSLLHLVPEEDRNFNDVWKIHEIDGNIIFQSYERLFIYNGELLKVIRPVNRFHFSFNVGGRLIIEEPGIGLFEVFDGFIDKVPWAEPLKDFQILSILEIGENQLLIGTDNNGFYLYDQGTLSVWDTEVNNFIKENKLFSATKVVGNHLAFGTILNGLVISDINGNIVQQLNREKGMGNNTILSVFADKNDNLWLGLDNGIDYVEINSPTTYITDNGNIGTGYCCKVFDDKLYLGTNQGLFVRPFNAFSQSNENFELVENSASQVWSLYVYDNELICCHNFGTFKVSGNKAVKISDEPGAWAYTRLKGNPDLLLGGHYNGLSLLKKGKDGWEFFRKIKGFEESSKVLFQDQDGTIWMSHGGKGIFRISLSASLDSVANYRLYGEKEGLPSNIQNIIFHIKDRMYVSTVEGAYEYDATIDSFKIANALNQAFNFRGRIKTVETDENDNIWYVSENEAGVLRQNEDLTYTKITSPFEALNGHFVGEYEFIYPYSNDDVFFGIDNGFAHYSSKFRKSYVEDFHAFITDIKLGYIDSIIYSQNQALIHYEFPYRKNSFRFHYTAPFYENLSDLRFSYFLENYSEDWSEWSVDIYKDFTNLPFGDYNFKIKALNKYGVESSVDEFKFTILPPWYRTSMAYGLYVLITFALLLFLVLFIRYRMRLSKEREKKKHEKELKKKEEIFQHQALVSEKEIIKLRNDKLRADMIYRDKELVNQTNSIIQKNKFLRKLNDELRLLQNSTDDASVRTKIAIIKKRISKETENKQQKVFETYFDNVHEDFFERLKERFPHLSPKDMRLCAYIRMNISTKEIATLLNISDRGVEITRYRLRKKLELSREINLSTFLAGI